MMTNEALTEKSLEDALVEIYDKEEVMNIRATLITFSRGQLKRYFGWTDEQLDKTVNQIMGVTDD